MGKTLSAEDFSLLQTAKRSRFRGSFFFLVSTAPAQTWEAPQADSALYAAPQSAYILSDKL